MLLGIFWPFRLLAGLLRFFLNMLVFTSCLLTAMAFMGEKGWLWSLTTHFRMQYLMIQLAALVIVSLGWWWRNRQPQTSVVRMEVWLTLVFLMFFIGLNLSRVAPYYWPPAAPPAVAELQKNSRIRLMHVNLFGYLNHRQSLLLEAVKSTDPDIVDFVEYTASWQKRIEASSMMKRYPYHYAVGGHVGLYSKRPLSHSRLEYSDPKWKVANMGYLRTQVVLGGVPVTLLVAHPASPIRPSHLEWQHKLFDHWVRSRPQLGDNLVIAGDLNTAPWSREFQALLHGARLRDSMIGHGVQPTWPTFLPIPGSPHEPSPWWSAIFGIPIDHVLVSPRIAVLARHTGPFLGSDHLPVVVDLALRK